MKVMEDFSKQAAIDEEARRCRRLQFLMDLTLNTIAQSRMSYTEALELVQFAKTAALKLFPDDELLIDMIYMSRFRRLADEKYRLS